MNLSVGMINKIVDYIAFHALKQPQKVALICHGEKLTYMELYDEIKSYALRFSQQGIVKGQTYLFKFHADRSCVVTYFALHQIGAIAVPLEKSLPNEKIGELESRISRHGPFIINDVADILFTTGTTGVSKGVIISHDTILADAENLADAQGFTSETVFLICGPLNHIGSLSKMYPTFMMGGTVIIIDGIKNLDNFYEALDYPSYKLATFLVPSSIRMLLLFSKDRLVEYKDKIDFIETGAAAISHSDMLALCKILPNTRIYNTYASTETGIISTYNFNDGNCIPGCLGRPMKNSGISITEKGNIACSGRTLMSGYVDMDLDKSVIKDNVLVTSDLGYLDEEGMLHLTGREDDVINVGGLKVEPSEVEDVVMAFPGIKDCICIAVPHPITDNTLKLLVVFEKGVVLDKKRMARFIATKLESYKVPLLYEQVDSIKRTFNGKLDRKAFRTQKREL